MKAYVKGVGSALPQTILTNEELAKRVDTTDAWILSRTGIKQRYIATEGEKTSDLATEAAKKALADAKLTPSDVDLIIVATTTPDNPFPATATRVQNNLGCDNAYAFDVQAVCSGFLYALQVANLHIKTGEKKCVLVIGAETMSTLLDWEDRATCVLFGDGAGAFVLTANDNNDSGLLSCHLHSDGCFYDDLYVEKSEKYPSGVVRMQGREIFKNAVAKIGGSIFEALDAHGLKPTDIDWFVPHQANIRIINGIANHFKLDPSRFVVTIDQHANTSAASIPLAYDVAKKDGRIQPCQLIVLEAMGGGLTWGSVILKT